MAETIDNDAFVRRRRRLFLIIVGGAVLATIVGVALLMNIFERKQEARNPFYRVVELTDDTDDPAIWGKNFPLQYDDYKRTVDQVRTRYGGSEAEPRTPTKADPRSIVAQSKIEEDPRLKAMWAGYAFAKDFREERGHAYMLEDQMFTERQQVAKQPGTCIQCHASVYVAYKKAGNGDIIKGFEKMNQMPYFEARKMVTHPVACIDCHDSRPCNCASRAPLLSKASARSRPRRACRTTTSTSRRRARRCAHTSAASATSSITSRGRRSDWSIPGPKGSRSKTSSPITTRRIQRLDPRRHRRARAQGAASGI